VFTEKLFNGILEFWFSGERAVKRLFVVTGSPGIGKTTVMLKTAENLRARGCLVGGMISRDVRTGGDRIGFELLDLESGKKGSLASVHQNEGPRVGKYRVNIEDLVIIGAGSILRAIANADVIIIDEIGPMELFSPEFVQAVLKALDSGKPIICTVHWKMKNELIDKIGLREDVETYIVTNDNRDRLNELLVQRTVELLSRNDSKKGL
jgi:nucleoside-triphosphatase